MDLPSKFDFGVVFKTGGTKNKRRKKFFIIM